MKWWCGGGILYLLTFFFGLGLAAEKTVPKMSEMSEIKILFLGDSLTAGFGVAEENSFPNQIEKMLKSGKGSARGPLPIKIYNAGISGSTTASAIKRLKWFSKMKPDILVLALGANDGLRGISVTESRKNFQETLELAKTLLPGMRVLLAGMLLPPNYGPTYRKEFSEMFSALAEQNNVKFMPFLLEGVGGVKELNQADGIHPNERGHEVIARGVLSYLLPMLDAISKEKGGRS